MLSTTSKKTHTQRIISRLVWQLTCQLCLHFCHMVAPLQLIEMSASWEPNYCLWELGLCSGDCGDCSVAIFTICCYYNTKKQTNI